MNLIGSLVKKRSADRSIGFLCHPLPVGGCQISPSPNALPVSSHVKSPIFRKVPRRFDKDLPSPGLKPRPFTLRQLKPLSSEVIEPLEEYPYDADPFLSDALPIIDGWAVPFLNAIFCANSAVVFNLNKAEYAFAFEPEAERAQPVKYTPEMIATVVAGNHRFSVGFDQLNFVDALDGVITQKLPEEIQCAFVEAWFGILFEKLEQWRGTRIHVESLNWRPDISENDDYHLYFRLSRQSDKLQAKGHVSMGREAMQWLAEGYTKKITKGIFPGLEKFPFELGFEIGWMRIDPEQFSRLVSNDILLPDKCTFDSRGKRVLVRLAQGPCWVGNIEPKTITITAAGEIPMGNGIEKPKKAPPGSAAAAGKQPASAKKANPTKPAGAPVKTAAGAPQQQNQKQVLAAPVLDGLHIDLVFEVGRRKITLQELRKIKPGFIFDLAAPLDRSISVVANGRTVGKGTLVQIDQRLGVRLLEIVS
jgi:flagellar motor switch/type III secretory pathway protein FliN